MESIATIESFVRSAEGGSFSAAARKLGVTPAAVSKNVATLEARLGVRLFQRSTRSLKLTELGERFLRDAEAGLTSLQQAVDALSETRRAPSGRLRVSMASAFGRDYIIPLLPAFLARYPDVEVDFQFENRQIDLIGEGYDAAIGGSLELGAGLVARELGRAHIVAVASPAYLATHGVPRTPDDLAAHRGVLLRSPHTGRLRSWTFHGPERRADVSLSLQPAAVFDDMDAICHGALAGLGIGLVAMPSVLAELQSGALVRVLPRYYADSGAMQIYYASAKHLPGKTRAFVDFVVAHFRREKLAARFRGD